MTEDKSFQGTTPETPAPETPAPERPAPGHEADSPARRFLRWGLNTAVAAVILAMYFNTPSPTLDVKWLILCWASAILSAVWIVDAWLQRAHWWRPGPLTIIVSILTGLLVVSAFQSAFPGVSMLELRRFFALTLLGGCAAYAYRTSAQIRTTLLVCCLSVLIASLYGFCQKAGLDPFPWDPAQLESPYYQGAPATFGNPNYAGHVLILAVIAAIYLATSGGMRWMWALLPVYLIHLHFTGHRAGWVALGTAALLVGIAWAAGRWQKPPLVRSATVALTFGAAMLVLGGAILGYVQLRAGGAVPLDRSILIRYHAYLSASEMIASKPLLGFGPGVYQIMNPVYWTPYEQQMFAQDHLMNEHVHNDLLEFAVDAGFAAAASYLLILASGVFLSLRIAYTARDTQRRRLGYALAALICAFAVDGLFGFNIRTPAAGMLLFLFLGMIEGTGPMQETEGAPSKGRAGLLTAVLGVALLGAAVTIAAGESRQFTARYTFQQGRAAVKAGDIERAQDHFGKAAELAAWDWRIPLEQGRLFFSLNRPKDAIPYFEAVLTRHPYHLPAMVEAGRASLNAYLEEESASTYSPPGTPEQLAKAFERPVQYAQRALDICPPYPRAHSLLGRSHCVQATLLEKYAARFEDQAPEAMDALTGPLWREAIGHLQQALRAGEIEEENIHFFLAASSMGIEAYNEAKEALQSAVKQQPTLRRGWDLFLEYARQTGDYDAPRASLEASIEAAEERGDLAPDTLAMLYHLLARVLAEGDDQVDEAVEAYRRAVALDPASFEVWSDFAQFAANHEQFYQLEAQLKAVAESDLQDMAPPVAAVAMAMSGDPEQVRQGAELLARYTQAQTSRMPPDQPRFRDRLRGRLAWVLNLMHAEINAPRAPEANAPAQMYLGAAFGRVGLYQPALQLLEQALPHLAPPEQVTCRVLFAEFLTHAGQLEQAIQVINQAIGQRPDQPELHILLARLQAEAGDTEGARRSYRQVLEEFELGAELAEQLRRELEGL